ncbi:peptidase [Cellulomonas sp. McL0617]|uniref:peptidase n=1 Tax=Cellulomonas sp. McL0617 TaxID=3415675 RepID=UPI003CF8F546
MVRLVRGAVAAFLAIFVAVVCAVPSSATDVAPTQAATVSPYGCLGAVDAYGAPLACQLAVHVITPICDKDVPKLKYDIQAVGSPNTVVKITFLNPNGPNVVYADQPLSGTVLWPGAVVGPDGRGADWPGWRQLADGSWVQGDEFDWVRPDVKVLFQVNPEATVTVAYPPSSPTCATNPPTTEVLAEGDVTPVSNVHHDPTAAVLSATGSNDAPLLFAALGFVVIGGAAVTLVAIARRRKGQDA